MKKIVRLIKRLFSTSRAKILLAGCVSLFGLQWWLGISSKESMIAIVGFIMTSFIQQAVEDSAKLTDVAKSNRKLSLAILQLFLLYFGLYHTESESKQNLQQFQKSDNARLVNLMLSFADLDKRILFTYWNFQDDPQATKEKFFNDVFACQKELRNESQNSVLIENIYLRQVWKNTSDSLAKFQSWPSGEYNSPLDQSLEKARSIVENFCYLFNKYFEKHSELPAFAGREFVLEKSSDTSFLNNDDWIAIKHQADSIQLANKKKLR